MCPCLIHIYPFSPLSVQWPWLLTMKLEPNIPIASLGQKEPRRRYIEHTLAEICHPSASGPDGLLSTCCEYRPLSDSAGFTALTHRIKSNATRETHHHPPWFSERLIPKTVVRYRTSSLHTWITGFIWKQLTSDADLLPAPAVRVIACNEFQFVSGIFMADRNLCAPQMIYLHILR